ncbi:DUF3347 domain-containing protein [Formosa haliotis]|uniref:DUF3347 domain-containing protein n=1 Tax=Formosa haliotis TaxID=1555194 RepID=UPI0008244211|nr:DUF3347 domain-containing protein [Formosa haliotis]
MKNVKQMMSTTVLALALITVTACKNETKNAVEVTETPEVVETQTPQVALQFKDAQVGAAFQHYIHLKTALVNSDAEEAKSGARMLAETNTDEHVKALAVKISETDDIKVQRELFSELTTALKPILASNISSGEIYEQHCPMALQGGANWFAKEKEVNNPYYGDAMLHCGVVQETLN